MATLSEKLRERTSTAHEAAEGSSFQGLLARGQLALPVYAAYMKQLYLIHDRLERYLVQNSTTRAVVSDEQLFAPSLRADLQVLNQSAPEYKGLKETDEELQRLDERARDSAVTLLGCHYVLYGSKHGGQFIGKSVKANLELTQGGTSYFEPGPTFRNHWLEFKRNLDMLDPQTTDVDGIIDAAEEMFAFFGILGDSMMKEFSLAVPS